MPILPYENMLDRAFAGGAAVSSVFPVLSNKRYKYERQVLKISRAMDKQIREFAPSERLLAIAEEFLERARNDDTPTVEQFVDLYPDYADEIRRYLPMLIPTSSTGSIPRIARGQMPVPLEKLPAGINRYLLNRLLGSGSMGAVYLARDLELDRVVAFKIPRLKHSQTVERFYREARSMATVVHPHICPIYDVGEIGEDDIDDPDLGAAVGCPYLTMAYIEGDDLSELMTTPWDPKVAVTMIRKVASALDAAHAAGVVHRDIKPGNIIVDRNFEPAITDFGLARRDLPDEVELTMDGQIIGSPAYMSPEQINCHPELGPQADIYSLGVVLFEMVCGQRPFNGSPLTLLRDICWKDPPSPIGFRPELDKGIEAICLKAISRDPEHRYQTAADFAADLDAWLEGREISPARRTKSNRMVWYALPILAACLFGLFSRPLWDTPTTGPGPVDVVAPTVKTISEPEFHARLKSALCDHFKRRKKTLRTPDVSSQYRAAFADYGINPQTTSPSTLSQLLASEEPASQTGILVGLEAWLLCQFRETEDVPTPWLLSLLEANHPDHTPLRRALHEMDKDRLSVLVRQYQFSQYDPRLAVIFSLYLRKIDKAFDKEYIFAASETHPDDPWVNLAKGFRQKANGNAVGAIETYLRVSESLPCSALFADLGAAYNARKQFPEAVEAFSRAIELDPEYPTPHQGLGRSYYRLGQLGDATRELRFAVDNDCDALGQAYRTLAMVELDKGDVEAAVATANQAIAVFRVNKYPANTRRLCKEMLSKLAAKEEHGYLDERFGFVTILFETAKASNQFKDVPWHINKLVTSMEQTDEEVPADRIAKLKKWHAIARRRKAARQ